MAVDAEPGLLPAPPRQFFMNLRDLALWTRSARSDALLGRLRAAHEPVAALDQLYRQQPDPWGALLPGCRYQQLKYRRLLSLLPRRAYARALDLGCGLGVLTRLLAPHVAAITGVELAPAAVATARGLSTDQPNATFVQGDVLDLRLGAEGVYDLVVIADVLYYCSPLSDARLKAVVASVERLLAPGGVLALANHSFFGLDHDSRVSRRIHDAFRWAPRLSLRTERWWPFFLASVLTREREEPVP
jgi:SAM-dependent methyltransferase